MTDSLERNGENPSPLLTLMQFILLTALLCSSLLSVHSPIYSLILFLPNYPLSYTYTLCSLSTVRVEIKGASFASFQAVFGFGGPILLLADSVRPTLRQFFFVTIPTEVLETKCFHHKSIHHKGGMNSESLIRKLPQRCTACRKCGVGSIRKMD